MRNKGTNQAGNKNSNISQLMSSIESKLQLLAKDDFDTSFPQYNRIPTEQQLQSPSKNSNLNIQDLYKSRSSYMSSPILSRFSQIEEHYLSKLTVLNQKITIIQSQNTELLAINKQLQQEVNTQKQRIYLLEQDQEKMLDNRVQEMKENLIDRLRSEVQEETQSYLIELSQIREQLASERMGKKQLEKQLQFLGLERDHFQEMYRQLMSKYKNMMQADLSYNESSSRINRQNQLSRKTQKRQKVNTEQNIVVTKPKKSKQSKKEKGESMPKQKLIPFLAQGIQDLKEKLSLK